MDAHDDDSLQIRQRLDVPAASTGSITRKPWAPLQDPDRPSLPYIPGFTVQIQPHEAPAPFGHEKYYDHWPRRGPSDEELETMTQSAIVVSYPPLEANATTSATTSAPPLRQEETAQLTINSSIRIGCGDDAQIVRCTVTPPGRPFFEAVAKIYDALYYRFVDSAAAGPRDVTAQADMDYTREVAAYKHLMSAGETGRGVPEFYGSWTFKLPITSRGVACQRPVRVLLIEHIDGVDLKSSLIHNNHLDYGRLDAFHLPEDYRLEVLARMMEIHTRCIYSGVEHMDLTCRNVMIVTNTSGKLSTDHNTAINIPRVVLVNFNASIVYRCTTLGSRHPWGTLDRPVNPLELCWNWSMAADFGGWAPREWENSERLRQQWLLQTFGGEEKRALYEPVISDFQLSND